MCLSLILSYDSFIEPRYISENIPKINSAVKHLKHNFSEELKNGIVILECQTLLNLWIKTVKILFTQ